MVGGVHGARMNVGIVTRKDPWSPGPAIM